MRARGCEIAQPMCKLAASSHGCNKVVPSRARELASSRDETVCPQRGELAICELAICELAARRACNVRADNLRICEIACWQRGELAMCELVVCKTIYSRRGELAICELAICEIACSRRGELAICEIARLNSRYCGRDGIVPGTH